METGSSIKLFQEKTIRSTWNAEEELWYFSLVDIVEALTYSTNPRDYLKKKLRRRDLELDSYLGTNCPLVAMITESGKMCKILARNTRHIFHLVQSIPSPRTEPFKLWLAQVGYELLRKIESPELAQERMKGLYEEKGYSKDWIDKRLRGMTIRQNRTDEWKERGISSDLEFTILTAEISQATFRMTPAEYKSFKGLAKKNGNLRDHMTDLELILRCSANG